MIYCPSAFSCWRTVPFTRAPACAGLRKRDRDRPNRPAQRRHRALIRHPPDLLPAILRALLSVILSESDCVSRSGEDIHCGKAVSRRFFGAARLRMTRGNASLRMTGNRYTPPRNGAGECACLPMTRVGGERKEIHILNGKAGKTAKIPRCASFQAAATQNSDSDSSFSDRCPYFFDSLCIRDTLYLCALRVDAGLGS